MPNPSNKTSDGGYIVAGSIASFGAGGNDAWVLKLDGNGEIPGCGPMGTSAATVTDTGVSGSNTGAGISNTAATVTTPSPTVANTAVTPAQQCFYEASCLGTGAYRFGVRAIEERTEYPYDEEGIPGVEVVLTGPGGCTDTATTNAYGRVRFNNLAPGTYTATPTPGTPGAGCAYTPVSKTKTITTRPVNARFIGSCP
jgi:hypothetical protein